MKKIKKLMEHRDTILLAEIGALIHDLGKLSEEFISVKSQKKPPNEKDKHAEWIFIWHPYLKDLLNNFKIRIEIHNNKTTSKELIELSIKELIKYHHNRGKKNYLIELFSRSADGIDSGIDKGAVININKQSERHTYISTSFGYEFERININSQQLKQYREKIVQKLKEILEKIQRLRSDDKALSEKNWVDLRKELLSSVKECFVHALGETRRSANDVTLWDHSYSTASLYKTALADIFLSGKQKDPIKVKWRLLSIRFNGFDYITKGSKISDILGRKKKVELALDSVKNLLEVYIPLGSEIYRDENGSAFLIPDSFNKNALNEWKIGCSLSISLVNDENDKNITINSTDTVKSAIEKIFNEATYSELKPVINVSEVSRGAVNLGKELEENKVHFNQPFVENIKRKWNKRTLICKVCGLKPCVKKNEEYSDLCEDCRKIRQSRAETWCNERIKYKHTIWIDEVCDKYGRVGVIVGAFDLNNWLNGMWLNTTFTKTLRDLKEEKQEIFHKIKCWKDLINAVKEALGKNNLNEEISFKKSDGSNVNVKELFESLALVPIDPRNYNVKGFFNAIIKNREEDVVKWAYYNQQTSIDTLSSNEKAILLVLALLRKNPSFARIRRIWETAKGFWDQIELLIRDKLDKEERIKVTFKIPSTIDLKEFMAYTLKVKGISIPVVYIGHGEFLIIETRKILKDLKIDERFLEENLKKGNFELWQPSEYKEESRKLYSKEMLKEVRFISITKDTEYYPYIVILKEPSIFVVLIPLQRSLDIIKLIKKEYEIQFSKVQNRLPIKLGLIAFKRKYPLYVVLDTVKRFLGEEIEENVFKIERLDEISAEDNCKMFDGRLGNYAKILELLGDYRKFTVYISYSTGDPCLKDMFYPYVIVKDAEDKSGSKTLIYKKYSEKYSINNLVRIKHVSELSEGEEIFFEPSLFDFEFLDSNVRRFDIGKKRKHWLFTGSESRSKPYLLWDIENFERLRELVIEKLELTTTQVMNLYEMLMSKIEEWDLKDVKKLKNDELFKRFVDNAIKDIPLRLKVVDGKKSSKGKIVREDYEFLKNSILSGMFFDFVDLWHTILKFEFKKGGEENV